jgi:hypothetical protein
MKNEYKTFYYPRPWRGCSFSGWSGGRPIRHAGACFCDSLTRRDPEVVLYEDKDAGARTLQRGFKGRSPCFFKFPPKRGEFKEIEGALPPPGQAFRTTSVRPKPPISGREK